MLMCFEFFQDCRDGSDEWNCTESTTEDTNGDTTTNDQSSTENIDEYTTNSGIFKCLKNSTNKYHLKIEEIEKLLEYRKKKLSNDVQFIHDQIFFVRIGCKHIIGRKFDSNLCR